MPTSPAQNNLERFHTTDFIGIWKYGDAFRDQRAMPDSAPGP